MHEIGRSAACYPCYAGYEALQEGSIECSPCPVGHYKSHTDARCMPAPAGTYVDREGAGSYTVCPVGTFSNATGAEACEPCPPGQYSNIPRSTACKVMVQLKSLGRNQSAEQAFHFCILISYATNLTSVPPFDRSAQLALFQADRRTHAGPVQQALQLHQGAQRVHLADLDSFLVFGGQVHAQHARGANSVPH